MPTTRTIAYVIVEEMKHRKRHDACLMCFKTLHLLPNQPVHHLPPAPKAKDIYKHLPPTAKVKDIYHLPPTHKAKEPDQLPPTAKAKDIYQHLPPTAKAKDIYHQLPPTPKAKAKPKVKAAAAQGHQQTKPNQYQYHLLPTANHKART
jgi:hypothetical protein